MGQQTIPQGDVDELTAHISDDEIHRSITAHGSQDRLSLSEVRTACAIVQEDMEMNNMLGEFVERDNFSMTENTDDTVIFQIKDWNYSQTVLDDISTRVDQFEWIDDALIAVVRGIHYEKVRDPSKQFQSPHNPLVANKRGTTGSIEVSEQ